MSFGDNLKQLRTEFNVTQNELASYLNVTRPTIAGYETKGKEPDYKTLVKISDFFHISLDYLLRDDHGVPQGNNISYTLFDKHKKRELQLDILRLNNKDLFKLQEYTKLLLLQDGYKK